MKKITLLAIAFTFAIFNLQAQDEELVSKKGFPILPEAGDYAFGVDLAPLVNFIGGTTTSNGPSFDLSDGMTIFGKYYAEKDMAYRVKFAFNTLSTNFSNYVTDQSVLIPTPEDQVEDNGAFSYSQFVLGLGFEKRKGKSRLQGYYGADFFFMYATGSSTNQNFKGTYGNDFSANHTMPISTNFVTPLNGYRTVEVKQGGQLGLGLRAFVGVEYFIAPKISIGGELGWGVAYAIGFDGYQIDEEWDAVAGDVKSTKVKTASANQFIAGSDASASGFFEGNGWLGLGGSLNLVFHF